MKPSEMTNERIAEELIATIPHLSDEAWSCTDADDILREAAARLRKSEERVSKQKSINKELVDEVADLRCRLKVAEDALDKIYKCIDNRYGVDASLLAKKITADALAAIRIEAAAKQPVTNCNHLVNAAKMREALVKADAAFSRISQSAWFIDANFSETKEVMDAGNAIEEALSAPQRNCDRFSNANEALEAFEKETGETIDGSLPKRKEARNEKT